MLNTWLPLLIVYLHLNEPLLEGLPNPKGGSTAGWQLQAHNTGPLAWVSHGPLLKLTISLGH